MTLSAAGSSRPDELPHEDTTAGAAIREQAEAVLRETAQFYIAIDERGIVRGWNRSATRVFGFDEDTALGSRLAELIIPATHREPHHDGIAAFVRTGHGRGVDAPVVVSALRADGSLVPVELTIWAQETPSGYLFHALGSDLTERRAHEQVLRVLAEHRRALLHLDRPADVQHLLVDTVLRATGCDGAWLYVPDEHSEHGLRLAAHAGRRGAPDASPRTALGAVGHAGAALRPTQVSAGRLTVDAAETVRDSLRETLLTCLQTVSVEPVVTSDELVGLLAVGWEARRGPLPPGTQDLLSLLAAEAGLVMQRLQMQARLAAAAHTDSLTGLANRRAFDDRLARELSRAVREGESLALVLVDLDHFKDFNDQFGHPAGDELLRRTSEAWSSVVRAPDLLARLGGDEFALILPTADEQAAAVAVARLLTTTPDGTSFSTGTAARQPGDDAASMVQRADQDLYRSKRARR